MLAPACYRDPFPISQHSSAFTAPAFNPQVSTVDSLLTPLFAASPPISRLTPLSTAFTHFDGGVGVTFHFPVPLLNCPERSRATTHCTVPIFRLLVFITLQIPLHENAPVSIFNLLPFSDLQIPLSATPLFSHLSKTPGCHPSTFPWATAWQRRCAALPFLSEVNLSLAVPKNATYNLSPSATGANHGRR